MSSRGAQCVANHSSSFFGGGSEFAVSIRACSCDLSCGVRSGCNWSMLRTCEYPAISFAIILLHFPLVRRCLDTTPDPENGSANVMVGLLSLSITWSTTLSTYPTSFLLFPMYVMGLMSVFLCVCMCFSLCSG